MYTFDTTKISTFFHSYLTNNGYDGVGVNDLFLGNDDACANDGFLPPLVEIANIGMDAIYQPSLISSVDSAVPSENGLFGYVLPEKVTVRCPAESAFYFHFLDVLHQAENLSTQHEIKGNKVLDLTGLANRFATLESHEVSQMLVGSDHYVKADDSVELDAGVRLELD